ncbi:MAG: hypothetical protein AAGC55_29015, partial [Myxococcota bacterium]
MFRQRRHGCRLREVGALLICIGLLVALGGAAHGQPTESQDTAGDSDAEVRARALFEEGLQLMEDGQHPAACARFKSSLLLFAGIGTRGKLAECYEEMGKLASAYELYVEIERLAREAGDPRARVAAERARELEQRVPRLTIQPGPVADVPGLEVQLDGRVLKPSSLGIALFVDPGERTVQVSAPEYKSWTRVVTALPVDEVVIELP